MDRIKNQDFINLKIMIISDESKFITALLAGISLTFFAIPSNTHICLENASYFISGLSSVFLIATAYLINLTSALFKIDQHDKYSYSDASDSEIKKIIIIFMVCSILFLLNLLLTSFRVSVYAGAGVFTALLLHFLMTKFLNII